MPLPLFLAIGAGIAAISGVGAGVHGAVKMKEANDTMKYVQERHEQNLKRFKEKSENTNQCMDTLGKLELTILKNFDKFSDVIEKIQNRPQFKEYTKNGITLPQYNHEELKKISIGAEALLGSINGAVIGTLGGTALTNATMAGIGSSVALSAGGGLLTTVAGVSTLGVGLLIGGVIFNFSGSKLSDKADEAWRQMQDAEKSIDTACNYLCDLQHTAQQYIDALNNVKSQYDVVFSGVEYTVNYLRKTDWNSFTENEKLNTQNAVLIVGLLYKMCQVNLVLKSDQKDDENKINSLEVNQMIKNSKIVLNDII